MNTFGSPTIVDFARDILYMQQRIDELELENERLKDYEQKYRDLITENIHHGEKMMGGLLTLILTKDITPKADRPEGCPQ